jgi:TnpA family transposase
LAHLQTPIEDILAELEAKLEHRIVAVNERILAKENQHVKRKPGGRWSLPYSRAAPPINHALFEQVPDIDIQTILQFAHHRTGMLNCFEHIQPRFAKHRRDDASLIAAIIAWGINMGIGRMGNISDIGFNTLSHISDIYLRLETLHAANDVLSDAIAALPIFNLYNINDTVHSSSDGQKFESALHTINARHSSKYFGLGKGVVAYTLTANHVPLNAQVIGTHEHESHFVFDLLMNNTTTIQPTIHSTDTHGTNHVNFALLHVFGYQFAPRYRDIYDKVRTGLYGFNHPSQYDDRFLLKPIRKAQKPLIITEWPNMIRIFLSLALKTTTQSIIVGKLSSYARKNRTKRALWEFDNILRSLYLLDFIDSLTLRRNVYHALSRGEAYNQLRRAVSFANFGALRFRTEGDQQIWGECSRLITNCIIYYNAVILSQLFEAKLQNGNEKDIQRLARVSPVAWRHVNFQGRYHFRKSLQTPEVEGLVEKLMLYPISLSAA